MRIGKTGLTGIALAIVLASSASASFAEEEGLAPATPTGTAAPAAAKKAKPDQAAIAKVKRLLDRAGAEEKKRAKLDAAGRSPQPGGAEGDSSSAARAADAATALEARDAALLEARSVSRQELFDGLTRAVVSGTPAEARGLAAAELAALKEPVCAGAIVKGFVREAEKSVRIAESRALLALANPDTALWFARSLDEKEPMRRIRAMQGLSLFRDRRVVETLVQFIHMLAGGFGGATAEFTTDRAYVSAWRMISGGTGLTVVEVADPEVDVMREGVSLEVKVRQVEMKFAVGLLQDLTGQSIGADPGAWKSWLAANPDWKLAAAKDAPLGAPSGARKQ